MTEPQPKLHHAYRKKKHVPFILELILERTSLLSSDIMYCIDNVKLKGIDKESITQYSWGKTKLVYAPQLEIAQANKVISQC